MALARWVPTAPHWPVPVLAPTLPWGVVTARAAHMSDPDPTPLLGSLPQAGLGRGHDANPQLRVHNVLGKGSYGIVYMGACVRPACWGCPRGVGAQRLWWSVCSVGDGWTVPDSYRRTASCTRMRAGGTPP